MRIILTTAVLGSLLASPATAGPIEKFYESTITEADKEKMLPLDGEPELVRSSGNPEADALNMYSRGYGLVGHTSFEWKLAKEKSFLKHAKKVGARYVVLVSEYFKTNSGAIPLTMPNSTTSHSSGTVTTGGGWGSYNGTTTTSGTSTTYIPYSQDRYNQTAGFFAPIKRAGFGFMPADLSREQASELGSNKGAIILAVRRGSPAFKADLLAGDVVKTFNGTEITTAEDLLAAIPASFGTTFKIELIRKGAPVTIEATMPANGIW